jgi:hypothetical protein
MVIACWTARLSIPVLKLASVLRRSNPGAGWRPEKRK